MLSGESDADILGNLMTTDTEAAGIVSNDTEDRFLLVFGRHSAVEMYSSCLACAKTLTFSSPVSSCSEIRISDEDSLCVHARVRVHVTTLAHMRF